MSEKDLNTIAIALLSESKTLSKISTKNSKGFKAVQQWLYDREDALYVQHQILRKDIFKLTFAVGDANAKSKNKVSLKD